HAFDRWPLDSCFRMVLETWLSYIQPWRYTDFSSRTQLEAQHSDTDLNKRVDGRWDNFVEDNLLFFTVLTSEFIPRIYRMDLTSPYSAYMVYRVSRVGGR
ncbi:sphingomyelin phosphodiesterase 4, partial [Plakobranchus ocellatus]